MRSHDLRTRDRLDLSDEELAHALGLSSLARTCAGRREADERRKREAKEQKSEQHRQRLDLRDRLDWLVSHAAERLDVTAEDVRSPRRTAKISMARHIIMYVIRTQEGYSYPDLADLIETRVRKINHSSVIRAVRKISDIVGAGGTEDAYLVGDIMRGYALLK